MFITHSDMLFGINITKLFLYWIKEVSILTFFKYEENQLLFLLLLFLIGIVIKENGMGNLDAVIFSGATFIFIWSARQDSSTAESHANDSMTFL